MSGTDGEDREEHYFRETLPLRALHEDGGGVGLCVFGREIQGGIVEGGRGGGGRDVAVVHVAYIGTTQGTTVSVSHRSAI